MTIPVLTFFNNKGGVGKTSLVYHLAWMYASFGKCVVAVDLDPQANLTAAFLDEDRIEAIWDEKMSGSTIFQCIKPLTKVGDIVEPQLQKMGKNLYLIPGDVNLSGFEDTLSPEWSNSIGSKNLYRPMRILSAFWQVIQMASDRTGASLILVDIGPNLGAINRSVLIATDYVVIPLGADLFSLQGLKNLGPTLRDWSKDWTKRLNNWKENSEAEEHLGFRLPEGKMQPLGYLCQQHGVRLDRPIKAYDKWISRIPGVYREFVLEEPGDTLVLQKDDPCCLGTIKHYRSLIPMAQEKRKPIFDLTPADGALGSHANAVQDARMDFRQLAERIARKMAFEL